MKVDDLLKRWEQTAVEPHTEHQYAVRLNLHDAARLRALAEMYPGRSETELITELLSAALDEVEAALPYVQGRRIVAEDEFGDPMYEDIGPTPRFEELTRKYLGELSGRRGKDAPDR